MNSIQSKNQNPTPIQLSKRAHTIMHLKAAIAALQNGSQPSERTLRKRNFEQISIQNGESLFDSQRKEILALRQRLAALRGTGRQFITFDESTEIIPILKRGSREHKAEARASLRGHIAPSRNVEAYLDCAQKAIEDNDLVAAHAYLSDAMGMHPFDHRAYFEKARLHLANGDCPGAYAYFVEGSKRTISLEEYAELEEAIGAGLELFTEGNRTV